MLLTYPRLKARQLLLQFSVSIAMQTPRGQAIELCAMGNGSARLLNWSNNWKKSIVLEFF
jgi:hypothetical protein